MLVTMTDRELYRLGIIQRVFDRALLQRDAADILELSVRQVQRLVRLYRTDGATAVERAHLTLQDRLVKELRIIGSSSVEAANAYADEFMDDYNERFAKAPRHDFDVHWPLENDDDLAVFFTWREHSSSVKISDSTV